MFVRAQFCTKLLLSLLICTQWTNAIKVCNSFEDYYVPFSQNCYDNPSNNWNITQIIQSWGFTAEEHYVTTEDGYELMVSRAYSNISQDTPIFLGPGLHVNGLIYVLRGNKSLAYILGNEGYDVWIVNHRGTKYSRGHVNLTTNDDEYWEFSIDELGLYDVRSTLSQIYTTTNQPAVFIGHSSATTASYIYGTTFPEEAKQRLKGIISYSPMGYFGPDPRSVWNLIPPLFPFIRRLVYLFFHGENLKYPLSDFLKPFSYTPGSMFAGQTFVNSLGGWNYQQMDPLTLPLFFQLVADSYGIDVVGHFVQLQKSGNLERYDHGAAENTIKYGQSAPPLYDLGNMSVPITFFVGEGDYVAPIDLAQKTYSEFPESVQCGFNIVNDSKWTHIDFLQGRDLTEFVYNPIINTIRNMESSQCVK